VPCYLPLLKVIQDIIEEITRICAMLQHSWVLEPTCQWISQGFFILFDVLLWEFEIKIVVKEDLGEMLQAHPNG